MARKVVDFAALEVITQHSEDCRQLGRSISAPGCNAPASTAVERRFAGREIACCASIASKKPRHVPQGRRRSRRSSTRWSGPSTTTTTSASSAHWAWCAAARGTALTSDHITDARAASRRMQYASTHARSIVEAWLYCFCTCSSTAEALAVFVIIARLPQLSLNPCGCPAAGPGYQAAGDGLGGGQNANGAPHAAEADRMASVQADSLILDI